MGFGVRQVQVQNLAPAPAAEFLSLCVATPLGVSAVHL